MKTPRIPRFSRSASPLLASEGLDNDEPSEQSILDDLAPNEKRAILAVLNAHG